MSGLVLFDFDGVIADSYKVFHQVFLEVFTDHGLQRLAREDVFLSLFDENFFTCLAQQRIEPEQTLQIMQEAGETLQRRLLLSPPFEGIRETLQTLIENQQTLAIITSNLSDVVSHWLHQNGILDLFQDILGADKGFSKTEKIAKATERWKVEPVYYIGDTSGDIKEANVAKLISIGAAWGWHGAEKLQQAGANHIATKPSALTELLC